MFYSLLFLSSWTYPTTCPLHGRLSPRELETQYAFGDQEDYEQYKRLRAYSDRVGIGYEFCMVLPPELQPFQLQHAINKIAQDAYKHKEYPVYIVADSVERLTPTLLAPFMQTVIRDRLGFIFLQETFVGDFWADTSTNPETEPISYLEHLEIVGGEYLPF